MPCFRTGKGWMGIKGSDLKVVEDLVTLEHPLKKSPMELIYSDLIFFLTCKSKKQTMMQYRKEMEQKLIDDKKLDEDQSFLSTIKKDGTDDEMREVTHDPFYRFGLGIYTYLKIQRSLIQFLGVLSVISVIQMCMISSDMSSLNQELMSEEDQKLTFIEKITSYASLGSYYQAYPLCYNVPLDQNSLLLQCNGDMLIQEVYNVNVINHGTQLCSTDKAKFQSRMKPEQLANLTTDIDSNTKCDGEDFFKKADLTRDLKKECLGNHNCTFNGKVHDYVKKEAKDCWDDASALDLVVQVKCGNKADIIQKRNKTGVICSCLGVLANLMFIIGVNYHLSRTNKIRALKFAEYTVSSKNFTCELQFDDDHFDYLCYGPKDDEGEEVWYQADEKDFENDDEDYELNESHWTFNHEKPGHALQDEVSRVLQIELTKFYGLQDVNNQSEWQQQPGYDYFKRAIKKFPEEEQQRIEEEIVRNQFESGQPEQFKVVFCTFAFKNSELLKILLNRSEKLANIKKADKDKEDNEEAEQKLIQEVLDANKKIVNDILGGEDKLDVEDQDEGEDGEGSVTKYSDNEGGEAATKKEDSMIANYTEEQISKSLLNEKKVGLMTPQSAFVTFKNPFAAFLAKNMMKIIKKDKIENKPKIFEKDIYFGKVGFPSDTNYFNFGMASIERIVNMVLAALIVYFWAYAFFTGMFGMYQMLQNRNLLILPTEKCQAIWNEYSGREFQFLDNSKREYRFLKNSTYGISPNVIAYDVPTLQKLRGEYTCYCDFLSKKTSLDFVDVESIFDPQHGTKEMCEEYSHLSKQVKYIKLIVTLFMSVCNAVSKKLIIWIIGLLNLKKKSQEAFLNFVYLGSITAFTSIFVILLLGAKLDFVPIVGQYLKDGKNRDFTWEWYMEIGGLFITRMIVLTIGPLIEVATARPAKMAEQLMFKMEIGNSKNKSMWQYYKSQVGKPFFLEMNMFKLGNVLLMAFMFGPGIPIMFPMAFLYVVFNESCLRFQLAYQCRTPNKYSSEMNRALVRLCAFMPVIYSSFGLWMYSNRQIYDNAVLPKAHSNGLQDHSHTVAYTLTTFTPGTPLIFLLVISIINFIILFCDLKYSKVFSFLPGKMQTKIGKLRFADLDNYYDYIKKDPQFKYFENLQNYMKTVLKTLSVSPKMYSQFYEDLNNAKQSDEKDGQQLFASRLLYEMIIDHYYASLFEFRYSLILNELTEEEKAELEMDYEQVLEGKHEDFDKFICAEDTKTLFLINYAFMDRKMRITSNWLFEAQVLENGKIVGRDQGKISSSSRNAQGRNVFDLQDLVVL